MRSSKRVSLANREADTLLAEVLARLPQRVRPLRLALYTNPSGNRSFAVPKFHLAVPMKRHYKSDEYVSLEGEFELLLERDGEENPGLIPHINDLNGRIALTEEIFKIAQSSKDAAGRNGDSHGRNLQRCGIASAEVVDHHQNNQNGLVPGAKPAAFPVIRSPRQIRISLSILAPAKAFGITIPLLLAIVDEVIE